MTYYLALAELAIAHLSEPNEMDWLDQLEVEHNNLRAALAWSQMAVDGAEVAIRLAGAMGSFWLLRGYLSEGHAWLTRALVWADCVAPSIRAPAFRIAGALADMLGDYQLAAERYTESLALYRELDDKPNIAVLLTDLTGMAMMRGEYRHASALCNAGLTLQQECNDTDGVARSLMFLGELARLQGDYAQALAHYTVSLTLYREVRNTRRIGMALANLGKVAQHYGDYEQAGHLYQESLVLQCKRGEQRLIAFGLVALASVAVAQRHAGRAARLFGTAEALFQILSARMDPIDRADYDCDVAALRAQLDEATFAAAWAEGRAMKLEQAIAEALEEHTDLTHV
jgi:tetratricopeptide (TPR) repeat protein